MEWESIGLWDPVWFNRGKRINHCSHAIVTFAISSGGTNVTARMSKKATKGASFCVSSIPHLSCLSYVVAHVCYSTLHYCFLSKCAKYDLSFRWALKHDSFIHSLDLPKLKALADDKINDGEKLKFLLGSVENIVEKGENAGYQHFLLFPQCFQWAFFFFLKVVKSRDCVV